MKLGHLIEYNKRNNSRPPIPVPDLIFFKKKSLVSIYIDSPELGIQ